MSSITKNSTTPTQHVHTPSRDAPARRPPAASWTLPLGGTRVDSLTGLRWFAAFSVFLFHAKGYLGESRALTDLAALGYEGVPFFFVLSGFVMTWVARPTDTVPHYYWRRFARIWPLLVVTTLATAALTKWWWHAPISKPNILWTLTFSQAWTTDHFMTLNIVTWTLSVEAFFYLSFPLVLRILLRRSSGTLALVAAAAVATTAATRVAAQLLDHPAASERLLVASPLALSPMFVLGVCTGLLVRRGRRPPFGTGTAAALTGGTILLCWAWEQRPDLLHPFPFRGEIGFFDAVLMPVFALLIACAALSDVRAGQGTRSVLRSRTLVKLGEWSFAYYLCHAVVLKVFAHAGFRPGPGLLRDAAEMGAAALGALVVAALLHELVEQPAERRLRRLLPARRA
ncbi:acyltransferase family protein [Streptomyces fradiae]|uniref:acyltransferase family protein n=1 Tax=Streptomyces fradiae TaxID=1906 RepID=UPI0035111361